MSEIITSVTNPRVKQAVALRRRRQRDRERLMLVEGATEVGRALDAGVHFETLFVCESLLRGLAPRAARSLAVDRKLFEKMSYRDNPDGLLGIAQQPRKVLADLSLGDPPLVVVAVGLEKPGNLGAILRTADGAGVDGLILCDKCTDPWNPNVIRASLGTVFSVPVVEAESAEAMAWLKARGVRTVAASPDGQKEYSAADLRGPLAIVLGEEHTGLDASWRAAADETVQIPMGGVADSLNVSATAAILLYEAVRQRS